MIADLERSFWQSLETNTEGEQIGERRRRRRTASELRNFVQSGRRRSLIASEGEHDDDYDDDYDKHDQTKECVLHSRGEGATGEKNESIVWALYRTMEHHLYRILG